MVALITNSELDEMERRTSLSCVGAFWGRQCPLVVEFRLFIVFQILNFDTFCARRGLRRNGCVAIEAESLDGCPVEVLVNENESKVISVGKVEPNMSFLSAITPHIVKGHYALGMGVVGLRRQGQLDKVKAGLTAHSQICQF
jgi:hypothetical protein